MTLPLSGMFSSLLFGGFNIANLNLNLRNSALVQQMSFLETVNNRVNFPPITSFG